MKVDENYASLSDVVNQCLKCLLFWLLGMSGWVMEFPFSAPAKVYLMLRVGYFLMPFHSELIDFILPFP